MAGDRGRRVGWVALSGLVSAVALVVPARPGLSEELEHWRVVIAAVPIRWNTDGWHGHHVACRDRLCDARDFSTGNLDNSFAYRLGIERDAWRLGRVALSGGLEVGMLFTEYNQSQRDFRISEALLVGGASTAVGPVDLILRGGLGGTYAHGERGGVARFLEGGAEFPLHDALGLRLTARVGNHAGPATKDFSFAFVAGRSGAEAPPVEFAWSGGLSFPGEVHGKHRSLSTAPLVQVTAHWGLGTHDRIGVGVAATAHESGVRSDYGSVPDNERGTEVYEILCGWDRRLARRGAAELRGGAGVKIGAWGDEFPLLVDGRGTTVEGGVEGGVFALLEGDLRVRDALHVVLAGEQVYWPALEMGELRVRLGMRFAR